MGKERDEKEDEKEKRAQKERRPKEKGRFFKQNSEGEGE